MADAYLQKLLGNGEEVILEDRQHWFVLFSAISAELIVTAIVIAVVLGSAIFNPLAAYGFILVVVPLGIMVRDILAWSNHAYVVTNHRVIQISGIINKSVIDSSLEKVNDVKMSQSFWGRMFGFGDIEILTASELGVNLFHEIANPIEFKTAM